MTRKDLNDFDHRSIYAEHPVPRNIEELFSLFEIARNSNANRWRLKYLIEHKINSTEND